MKILIVEDEPSIGRYLEESLRYDGFETALARTGEDAFFRLTTENFSLVILDWMLPGRSGVDILRSLRQRGLKVPVLLLTARDQVEDRVEGLDSGADDYLVKPFALPELLARIRSLLRRADTDEAHRLALADLVIDRLARRVTRAGETIDLTPREFSLLEYLFAHQGRIVSREMLAKDVWRETSRATTIDNVIDVQVARLRRKIDDSHGIRLIHTLRGVGFILREGA